jgi:hypothetical protein
VGWLNVWPIGGYLNIHSFLRFKFSVKTIRRVDDMLSHMIIII